MQRRPFHFYHSPSKPPNQFFVGLGHVGVLEAMRVMINSCHSMPQCSGQLSKTSMRDQNICQFVHKGRNRNREAHSSPDQNICPDYNLAKLVNLLACWSLEIGRHVWPTTPVYIFFSESCLS